MLRDAFSSLHPMGCWHKFMFKLQQICTKYIHATRTKNELNESLISWFVYMGRHVEVFWNELWLHHDKCKHQRLISQNLLGSQLFIQNLVNSDGYSFCLSITWISHYFTAVGSVYYPIYSTLKTVLITFRIRNARTVRIFIVAIVFSICRILKCHSDGYCCKRLKYGHFNRPL